MTRALLVTEASKIIFLVYLKVLHCHGFLTTVQPTSSPPLLSESTTSGSYNAPDSSTLDPIDSLLAEPHDKPLDKLDMFLLSTQNSSYSSEDVLESGPWENETNKSSWRYGDWKGLKMGNLLIMAEYIKREKQRAKQNGTQLPMNFFAGIVGLMSACVLIVGGCMAFFCDGGNTKRTPIARGKSESARSSLLSVYAVVPADDTGGKEGGEIFEV